MSANGRAHEKPPARIKDVYKVYQKLDTASLDQRSDLIDLERTSLENGQQLVPSNISLLPTELRNIFLEFLDPDHADELPHSSFQSPQIYEVPSIPGLLIYPNLFPPPTQIALLNKLIHRDLSDPQHSTNVHLHHHVAPPPSPTIGSPSSYFDTPSQSLTFTPKDPTIHKPITTHQFLERKLRWMTLGGQYDWTAKIYPSTAPLPFPPDIKRMVEGIFPMKAEAAIVNLYSPGDTLSLHRDVSEETDQPLVSISIGCDGIFVIGLEREGKDGEARVEVLRLRSGDAVLMSGESRFAWHGVPKVVEGTCPEWLGDWPCADGKGEGQGCGRFEHWKGWMKGKRINVNVRQMFD